MVSGGIFHPDFQLKPFWWDEAEPTAGDLVEVPKEARVAIIGGGYAGISAAIELHDLGIEAVVLDAEFPGFGGSSRSGGMVSGGVAVGKRYTGTENAERLAALYADAADSFSLVETLIEREKIDCEWTRTGRFGGAWCSSHYNKLAGKIDSLNADARSEAYLVPRERQHEEIASDYYRGGMVIGRAAHLHPAKYFRGLLEAAKRRGIKICAQAPVKSLSRNGKGWKLSTGRGDMMAGDVIVTTNGYTGPATPALQRRVLPVGSYIIATEEMPEDLAFSLFPNNRSIYDTRRVLTYYRMSGNRRRLIFGGRAKFGSYTPEETAPILYQFMTDRLPQLKGVKITHAWTGNVAFTFDEVPHMGEMDGLYYAMGCNGSGVAMMTYLGTQTARKLAGVANYKCAFDAPVFPDHWAYRGNPWFVPWLGRYFRVRDWIDRQMG